MHARGSIAISRERLINNLAVPHFGEIHHPPSRNPPAATAADLVAKKPYHSFLNAVIMRFCDSLVVFIAKSDQLLRLDSFAESAIQRFTRLLRFRHRDPKSPSDQ